MSAEGEVRNLKDIADFPGNYYVAEIGLTLAGGGDDIGLKNSKGVTMVVHSRNQGVQLNVGGGGVKIEMP